MIILVNASNIKIGGGIQVAHAFINGLKPYSNHTFHIVLSDELNRQVQTGSFPGNFIFYNYSIRSGVIKTITGWDQFLSKLEEKVNPDKVWSIFAPAFWNPKAKHVAMFAKSQYIYKDSPFFKQLSLWKLFKLKLREILHMHYYRTFCDILVTETNDVTTRLKKRIPSKNIYTISNYYHQIFDNSNAWDKTKVLPPFQGITLLTVAANYPHKNLNIITEVIACLKKVQPNFKFRFVLTIKPEELKITDEQIKQHIVFLGKTDIAQLPYLYQQADVMFLPTLLECFSASYPEAMRMGIPIITSDLPFARGLCENSAVYFNPTSPGDIAEKILHISSTNEIREQLIASGKEQLKKFDTTEERVRKYIQILENS